jgi:cysteine desulfurase/selenocysteine lyase
MVQKMHNIKEDFPIFQTAENKNLVYLDNGSTTHKPLCLLNAITDYYINSNSNIGRGVYKLAELSEKAYNNAREKVAHFINAKSKNIIFTPGSTFSLNQAAYIVGQKIKPKQKILLSIAEHHANILPWQRLAKEKDLEIIYITENELIAHPDMLPPAFLNNVAVIALTHVSNVTGQINPIEKWCEIARKLNIITVIDGAQGICSKIIDIESIDCDFYTFSAHKLYGPMGVGVLYINDKFLYNVEPLQLGGGIIEDVLNDSYTLSEGFSRFEPGTPNVADISAFAITLDYLVSKNWTELLRETHNLTEYLYEQIKDNPDLIIVNRNDRHILKHSHIISFSVKNIHAHDVGTFLSNSNIAIRVGKHCTHPLHSFLGLNSTARVSLGIYNTKEDIDFFVKKLNDCISFFKDI